MKQNIINIVHAMADKEKMPNGNKLHQEIKLYYMTAKMPTLQEWIIPLMMMKKDYNNNNKVEEGTDDINPNDTGEILQPTSKTKHVTFEDEIIEQSICI
jgi:hypothetical protein